MDVSVLQPFRELIFQRLTARLFSPTPECQRNNLILRLPAELRNRIYVHVLGGRTYRFKDTVATSRARLDTKGEKHVLGLLYVCRQIHFETALMPYTLNTFSFREFDISLEPFLRQRSPSQIRSIHYFELVTYQAVQMWASPEHFSPYMSREFRTLSCLPNLRELHFVAHMSSSLYVDWGSQPCLLDLEEKPLAILRSALNRHMPEVLLRVFLV
jgi:hypothetical protein